ncbi:MAG: hypothetical protein AAGC80_07930 [Rhodococcus sp. (in: high G+C Gram-positive bacteria)]
MPESIPLDEDGVVMASGGVEVVLGPGPAVLVLLALWSTAALRRPAATFPRFDVSHETLSTTIILGRPDRAHEAGIDTPCELNDFWRVNAHFARQIVADVVLADPHLAGKQVETTPRN